MNNIKKIKIILKKDQNNSQEGVQKTDNFPKSGKGSGKNNKKTLKSFNELKEVALEKEYTPEPESGRSTPPEFTGEGIIKKRQPGDLPPSVVFNRVIKQLPADEPW